SNRDCAYRLESGGYGIDERQSCGRRLWWRSYHAETTISSAEREGLYNPSKELISLLRFHSPWARCPWDVWLLCSQACAIAPLLSPGPGPAVHSPLPKFRAHF